MIQAVKFTIFCFSTLTPNDDKASFLSFCFYFSIDVNRHFRRPVIGSSCFVSGGISIAKNDTIFFSNQVWIMLKRLSDPVRKLFLSWYLCFKSNSRMIYIRRINFNNDLVSATAAFRMFIYSLLSSNFYQYTFLIKDNPCLKTRIIFTH